VIFRLVAIATYSILIYGVVNSPVVQYKYISVKLKEKRPKFFFKVDNNNIFQSDGIYLFGQSKQPDQIQNEYFVFELKNGKVIGAFYLPHSTFYCFYGTYQKDSLQVKVIDSYENSASKYMVYLQKYYQISQMSDDDFRILNTCKTNY